MKREEKQEERVLGLLKRCRLAASAPGRREQAIAAAHAAWTTTAPEETIPQWRPLLRFAAAIATTVLLVAVANFWDARFLARWQMQPASQGDGIDPKIAAEIGWNNPALARELMFLRTIHIFEADQVANSWLKQQKLLRELIDLEGPRISNGRDESPTSQEQRDPGNSWLMA